MEYLNAFFWSSEISNNTSIQLNVHASSNFYAQAFLIKIPCKNSTLIEKITVSTHISLLIVVSLHIHSFANT